jgi:hypothetical protein
MAVLAAPSAFAAKLSYHDGGASFDLVLNNAELIFHSGRIVERIPVKLCNREMLQRYWQEAVTEYYKLPILTGTPNGRFAKLDKETRLIIPTFHEERPANPDSIFILKLREAQACKR